MDLKLYIGVDASNINLINYIFTDEKLHGSNNEYPKPQSMAICGENSCSIFEKHGVLKEYQKMFMICNSFSKFLSFPSPWGYRKKNVFHRFTAREFVTDLPIYLSINNYYEVYGYMACDKPAFDVDYCYEVKKEDIIQFFKELREKGLFDNYLNALGEIVHMNIKSYIDSNKINKKTK